jgi:hypothetical protein
LFTNAFLFLLELDKDTNSEWSFSGAQLVVLMNAWLCLIPFIMHLSLTISSLEAEENKYSSWVLISIVTLLVYEIIYVLSITLYSILFYTIKGKKMVEYVGGQYKTPSYYYILMHQVLDVLCIVCKNCISLSIMGGALSLSSSESGHSTNHA